MFLGCIGTGCRMSNHPVRMAAAMRAAAEAGSLARGAGRIPRRRYARASSPVEGMAELGLDEPGRSGS